MPFDAVVSSLLGETAANLRKVFDYVGQSAVFVGTKASAFGWDGQDDTSATWHVVMRSEPRLDQDDTVAQRYALVVSLEHSDETVRLHSRVRQRVELRARQQWS